MKKKLLLITAVAFYAAGASAQYCGVGPTYTGDTNLQNADLVGESSSISYVGCPGVTGVEDETGQVADLFIGATYDIDLGWGTCGGNYFNGGNVWIDFDHSDSFDADEIVATKSYTNTPLSHTVSFMVPADALEGDTRMRIMQHEGGSPPLNPCASFLWGSVVDFTINLSTPCEDLVVTVSDYELCEGEELTLDAEGVGAITWTGGAVDEVPFAPGAPGMYTFTPSSDDEADCPTGPGDAVTVEVFGTPTVIAGAGDLVFCDGEAITLSAAGDADVYTWNDGDDLDLLPGVGTYTFTLTGEATTGGCIGEEVSDEVTVEVVDLPTITASVDPEVICIGLSAAVTAGGGETYDWDSGLTDGEEFTPTEVGVWTYSVVGTDENNCSNSASVDLEVVEPITLSGAVTDEIEGDDATINLTVAGGSPGYTFDWDNGETTEDLSDLTFGSYTVIVTCEAGCESTHTFDIGSQVGIEDLQGSNLSVYPNPTVENITIEMAGKFQYEFVAINGDILFVGTSTDIEVISLGDYASGIYFVNVKSENDATTVKVVKK